MRYSDRIYRYVFIHTGNPYLAEDITGEVFLRVWKKWKDIKQDFFQAFLYKVARNILIDYWRKKKEEKEFSLEESIEAGIEPYRDEDLIERIQKNDNIKKLNKAILGLPKNLKDVIILRFIEEMSAREASEVLGITEVNVRVLQFRALKKMREVLRYKNIE